jgi:hypothetical protein
LEISSYSEVFFKTAIISIRLKKLDLILENRKFENKYYYLKILTFFFILMVFNERFKCWLKWNIFSVKIVFPYFYYWFKINIGDTRHSLSYIVYFSILHHGYEYKCNTTKILNSVIHIGLSEKYYQIKVLFIIKLVQVKNYYSYSYIFYTHINIYIFMINTF